MKLRRILAGILTGAMVVSGLPALDFGTVSAKAENVALEGRSEASDEPSVETADTIMVEVPDPATEMTPKDAVLLNGGEFDLAPSTLEPMEGSEEGYQISDEGITGQVKFPNEKEGNRVFNITGKRSFLMHMQLFVPKRLEGGAVQSIIGKMDKQYGLQITDSVLKMFGYFDLDAGNSNWYEVTCDITDPSWYGKWHDVVGIYDGTEGKFVLYVDGVRSVPTPDYADRIGALKESTSSVFTIGYNEEKSPDRQKFTGRTKDIKMFIQQEGEESFIGWKEAVESLTDAEAVQDAFNEVLKDETPDLFIGVVPPSYEVTETKWMDESGKELPEGASFDPYEDYTVQVKVQAKDGTDFQFEDDVKGQINGLAAEATLSADKKTLTMTYAFQGQERPFEALGNYLDWMNDEVTNEDESGKRKYTKASWNAMVAVHEEAVELYNGGEAEDKAEEYVSKLAELRAAVEDLDLAAENCECEIGEITEPANGSEFQLTVDADQPKTEALPGTRVTCSSDCMVEGHTGKEPTMAYALDSSVQNTADGSIDAEKRTLTVKKPGAVGVKLTATLGNATKTIKIKYTVVGAPMSPDDKNEAGSLVAGAGTDYPAADKDLYSKENWDAFQAALKRLEEVVSSDASTAQDLQAAKEALNEAVAKLKGEAVKNVANAAKDAEELQKGGQKEYPADLWNAFTTAYANATAAESVLAAKKPAELKKIVSDLKAAKDALVNYKPGAPAPTVKVGDKEEAPTGTYVVTDVDKKTVKLEAGLKNAKGKVTIPATVDVKGTAYKVTAIGKKAFANRKGLKNVIIGGNVTSIETEAFSGCTAMTAVTLGENVSTIGKKAFYNCKKLKTVTVSGKKAPKIQKNAFKKTAPKVTVKAKKIKKKKDKNAMLAKMKKPGGMSKKSVAK